MMHAALRNRAVLDQAADEEEEGGADDGAGESGADATRRCLARELA